jgi:hypothetical protein
MAYTSVLGPPKVVFRGSANIVDNKYKAVVDGGDFKAGDFLRITANSGGVEPATMTTTDGTGGIQCMALQDYDASADGNIFVPVLEIADDTIFLQQTTSTTPTQAHVGALSTLDLTSGANAPTLTASEGVVLIDDIYLNKKWFKASDDECGAYGLVYFKLTPATLNAARTNESN